MNIKKNLPTILSVLGIFGSAAVGVSAGIAQHKVDKSTKDLTNKEEIAKVYIKHYWQTALIFAVTSGCIISSDRFNKKQYQTLLKAYTSLGAGFMAYRGAVIDKFDEQTDEELCKQAIAVMESDNYICLDYINASGDKLLFYEPISKKYFEAYERDVILAEYHLNRNFVLGMSTNVSQLLYFLGLQPTKETNKYGWNMEYGYYWIDIYHKKMKKDKHGRTVYEICYTFPPEIDYEEAYYINDRPYDSCQYYGGVI